MSYDGPVHSWNGPHRLDSAVRRSQVSHGQESTPEWQGTNLATVGKTCSVTRSQCCHGKLHSLDWWDSDPTKLAAKRQPCFQEEEEEEEVYYQSTKVDWNRLILGEQDQAHLHTITWHDTTRHDTTRQRYGYAR